MRRTWLAVSLLLGGSVGVGAVGSIPSAGAEGDAASLRLSVVATPGSPWDPSVDPSIVSFIEEGRLVSGDTVRIAVTVELTERSSAPLANPTIRASLPAGWFFVRNGAARLDGIVLPGLQQPTFTATFDPSTTLTWAWNNPFPSLTIDPPLLGSHLLTVELFARVANGQVPGTYTVPTAVVTDSVGVICELGTTAQDTSDIDADGDSTETLCSSEVSVSVEAPYDFHGFFQPIDMDKLNTVRAGSAIPVKFSLSGDQGLDIFAAGSPASVAIGCEADEPADAIEQTVTSGRSALSYDATSDQYVYGWKTDKAWSNTCRQLVVTLNDGSIHTAEFKFFK